MKKNVTIYDVAAHSGVSVASVSRVLARSKYPVSEETRQKVLRSAEKLNYTVNAMGKMLKNQSTREIGIIVPNISNPCYAMLVLGMQAVAIQNDYHVLLYNSFRNSENERRNIRMMMEKRVDGILVVSIGGMADLLEKAQQLNCRLITVEQELGAGLLHVGYDYARAGELATNCLLAHGHRAIAFLGAHLDRPSRVQMLNGYRSALSGAGIPQREEWIWLADAETEKGGIYEIENGKAAARYMAELAEPPTACVCLNDLTALGAMQAFSDMGIRIPEDMSIIGFDDLEISQYLAPGLTTIRQQISLKGQRAVELLLEHIADPSLSKQEEILPLKLIERGSVRKLS